MIKKTAFKSLEIFALSVILVLTLGFLDLHISIHPSLIVFYLFPVFLATWFIGLRAGIVVSLLSITQWFVIYVPRVMHLYYKPIFFYLNMAARISFLFLMIYLLTKLKSSLSTIKRQNEELEKLNDRKSAFVSNVSHEFRSPLSTIRESMALLLDGVGGSINAEQREILETGKKNIERLLRLVTDLLDLSKIEAGKMHLKKDRVDLNALIDEILTSYKRSLEEKQIAVKRDMPQKPVVLSADRDKLTGVIVNLLSNTMKYAPKGTVTIKLTDNGSEIRFEITDTGPGISSEHLAKIFDKFERITAEKQDGTGLGLPIAKDIVELHHGKIWAESALGCGSKFIFTLPR